MNKSYSELIKLRTFQERLKYLQTGNIVGEETFGSKRYLNQSLYTSNEWKKVRRKVILRDDGYDLGIEDRIITGRIYIHHINPITIEDVLERRSIIFDMENLVSTSFDTHNAIHYGGELLFKEIVTRKPNDTCPWR